MTTIIYAKCDYCTEAAVIRLEWWEGGIIEMTDKSKLNELFSCAEHANNLLDAFTASMDAQ